jgi:hypothetical protein
MTDKTRYTGDKPDFYFQLLTKHEDGTTEFKDAAVLWDKEHYSTGSLKVDGKQYKIIGRTREQRDALFAIREQKKQAQEQGQSQNQSQAPVADKPDMTPSI